MGQISSFYRALITSIRARDGLIFVKICFFSRHLAIINLVKQSHHTRPNHFIAKYS